jgi:hypothetical protein
LFFVVRMITDTAIMRLSRFIGVILLKRHTNLS